MTDETITALIARVRANAALYIAEDAHANFLDKSDEGRVRHCDALIAMEKIDDANRRDVVLVVDALTAARERIVVLQRALAEAVDLVESESERAYAYSCAVDGDDVRITLVDYAHAKIVLWRKLLVGSAS